MNSLEARLDRVVITYLSQVEEMPEVKSLICGKITKELYIRFLKTFYVLEYISQRAVNLASVMTREKNPYLSNRFDVCARGELGHAEIALEDLEGLGVTEVDIADITIATEYDDLLQDCAYNFPLGVLGHSYLFENTSGVMFPKQKPLDFPSKFVEVHAIEDRGHSIAIKRTIRKIEKDLSDEDEKEMLGFAKKSGEYLLQLFGNMKV